MPTFYLAIDTGGTFTDCLATDSHGHTYRRKVLSNGTLRGSVEAVLDEKTLRISSTWGLSRDVLRGYSFRLLGKTEVCKVESFEPQTRLLRLELPVSIPAEKQGFELSAQEEAPVLAARLITQTALDEAFPSIQLKLGSTKGTNALLEGKGARVVFFVTKGFGDLLRIGDQTRPNLFALHPENSSPLYAEVVEVDEQISATGEVLNPLQSLSHSVTQSLDSAAVCLKNAYQNPIHEQQVAVFLRERFEYVSVSTELSPQIKFLARAETTLVNAYLQPVIARYLSGIQTQLPQGTLHVMTSAGALVRADRFQPKDSLLSGPAGGVVGAAAVAQRAGYPQIITFDMGGTSTDVARYAGAFDYRFETRIGRARLQAPALAIETVAAGGGSVCGFDGYRLFVGPESAGASPGPACYGAGGPLTLTDVNLLLGRLDPATFGIPVFPEKAQQAFNELLTRLATASGQAPEAESVLLGFLQIANETMAEAVRKISVANGYDPTEAALVAFGGAGGLHACGVARLLGIRTILLPADAGLLSAVGIAQAPVERFAEAAVLLLLLGKNSSKLREILNRLEAEATAALRSELLENEAIDSRKSLAFLRLSGQENSLELDVTAYPDPASWPGLFQEKYRAIYGHWVEGRAVEVESLRVRVAVRLSPGPAPVERGATSESPRSTGAGPGLRHLNGSALLTDPFSTAFVETGFVLLRTTPDGTRILEQVSENQGTTPEFSAQTSLELFTNRFRAVAEEMGAMLQRTALSVNVKERLDFSCALLDADGRLVANAPHIPVHLGSLGVCVRRVREAIAMAPGDVIVTNHPAFGGSHLPDVTLITPVFGPQTCPQTPEGGLKNSSNEKPPSGVWGLLGYVVNRCHHAEIGGIRPASMPPNARSLAEEGVVISPMKLVENGEVRWERLREVLRSGPYPSRAVDENLADLAAALAANRRGEAAFLNLVAEHGSEKVGQQMAALLDYSAARMRLRLNQLAENEYVAQENLDDGTPLCVRIWRDSGRFVFDFSGSAGVHPGNLNGTEAIARSVVLYVLRVLLQENVPLNEGLMEPVAVILPENSILAPHFPANPADCPAVVGGNVELSQRLTGLLIKALNLAAGSQGTMNNVLFGNKTTSYYETIGGGGGATQGFAGSTARQQHMTNTRSTDPEILERRYPVRLHRFEIRRGSGGAGQWPGGDGIRRELEFLEAVELSVLSQHRNSGPVGAAGGQPGQPGRQWLLRADGREEVLGGMAGASLLPGDRLVIETPGGGGWGEP